MKKSKYLFVNIIYAGDFFCAGSVKNFREVSQWIQYYSKFFFPNEIEFIIKTI